MPYLNRGGLPATGADLGETTSNFWPQGSESEIILQLQKALTAAAGNQGGFVRADLGLGCP